MIVAILLYVSMALSTLSETPFIAWDIATQMSKCQRIEWSKMKDDDNNVKFIITFHKMPLSAELGFEKSLSKHKCCQTQIRRNK